MLQCRDRKGIVAAVSEFILNIGGTILAADQHSTDPLNGVFFMRVEFLVPGQDAPDARSLRDSFAPLAGQLGSEWTIREADERLRCGILVSKPGHCLFELLYLWRSGELPVDLAFVLSNCEGHRRLVEMFSVPFHFIPSGREDRQEGAIRELCGETDFLILARYMLTLSPEFLKGYGKDIINIHHGFLPSFKGAHPYKQAYDQGVKIIGATAHFVTEKLDEGPIITQMVESVTHKDTVVSLTRKGKKLEKHALADAVLKYLEHRIIRHGARTIVF